MPLFNICWKAG